MDPYDIRLGSKKTLYIITRLALSKYQGGEADRQISFRSYFCIKTFELGIFICKNYKKKEKGIIENKKKKKKIK